MGKRGGLRTVAAAAVAAATGKLAGPWEVAAAATTQRPTSHGPLAYAPPYLAIFEKNFFEKIFFDPNLVRIIIPKYFRHNPTLF